MRTRIGRYVLDASGEPLSCDDLLVWGRWLESADRKVAPDLVTADVRVSTVFLGLDHNVSSSGPPLLWETMVFGGPLDGEMQRYTSRAAALAGHTAMCQRVDAATTEEP